MMTTLRIWHKPTSKMYYASIVNYDVHAIICIDRETGMKHTFDFGDCITMSDTGLKDDDGNRIFTDDILQLKTKNRKDHPPHLVVWIPEKARFLTRRNDGDFGGLPHPCDTGVWHKIGNIHENPELYPDPA